MGSHLLQVHRTPDPAVNAGLAPEKERGLCVFGWCRGVARGGRQGGRSRDVRAARGVRLQHPLLRAGDAFATVSLKDLGREG